jgi:hypothetical protein
MNKKSLLLIIILTFILNLSDSFGQNSNPHILVSNSDKAAVLEKIQTREWAKNIMVELSAEVTPYVERHKNDPGWILSRYQMNRVPGKRYTRVYSDNGGLKIIKREGDAPVPTVRVPSHIRVPVTISGGSYQRPSLEDLVPNDTSGLMLLTNNETKKKELIDPQSFTGSINGEINGLALDAAIIYWLKGDESYARFAADILQQWAMGAYYQEPVIGPCRSGFLEGQTLGDGTYRSLILTYDFVLPYMRRKGYDLHYYETVFEKIASTLAFRGFWNNNWYAAESSTMVFAALSLENKIKKDYYLQFFLSKDTINGGCGQLALPSTVSKWLTPDGHWKEPGGYHNFPVSNLLISSLALEKNGYNIFGKFPELFRASYAMLKYSFPNLTVSAFGDTGRASQSPESLEIGILAAIKYNQPELPEMVASMKKIVDGGRYKREDSGYMGLLCFVPEIPDPISTYSWPRSGTLDFAKYFLQRNGSDQEYGLMYGVQGASYNHNHCNGMAVELYGMGEVMGIDAGAGATYEHPLHVNYYSQWAAHNTVVAAGSSSSVPFAGNAGRKDIGQIEAAAMEPLADDPAVSPLCSFTDTRYTDKSTNTNQARTLAIIRLTDTSGYYVDIYRSDNPVSNDYVYHNIGDSVIFLNDKREKVAASKSEYPLTGKDYPGFRFFTDVRKISGYTGNLTAIFSVRNSASENTFMQVLMPGTEGRTYFQALSLSTKTSGRQYSGKKQPLFTMRDTGESRTRPFIAVLEPYKGKWGNSVESISPAENSDPSVFTSLWVKNKNGSKQLVLQSTEPLSSHKGAEWSFTGWFGVAALSADAVDYLYIGKGREITFRGYSLKFADQDGSAWLRKRGDRFDISCKRECEITIPSKGLKGIVLNDGRVVRKINSVERGGYSVFVIPPLRQGSFTLVYGPAESQGKIWSEVITASDLFKAYPERIDAIFKNTDLNNPGLEKVKSALEKNDKVKACEQLLSYYSKGSTAAYLRKDLPKATSKRSSEADSIVNRIFTFYNQPYRVAVDQEGHLDWACHGPADDIEWAWGLNRHFHINTLLSAYFSTGNIDYVKTIDRDIKDWVLSSLPYPAVKSSTEMWRGLEVSFRVKTWSSVFYSLIKSPCLSPATRLLILSSIPEHAHYARNFHAQGNWLTMEMSGLATAATSWPEFKDSKGWLAYSDQAMTKSLGEQVYPDGVQTELTSSYHQVALSNFSQFMDICNNAGFPVSPVFREQIIKMWNYIAYSIKPDGYGLLNNDADLVYNRERVIKASEVFGRKDWLYIASNGTKGVIPDGQPSVLFPWAGQMIMRSGYEKDAQYAFFDIGPWGTGHQHNDKLNLTVSAYGRDILVDAGRFAYRGELASKFRGYATGSAGHNVVIPDGKLQAPGQTLAKEPVNTMSYKIADDYVFASGSFDRYTGLQGRFEHNRSVLYIKGKFWVVLDKFTTDRPRTVDVLWHFHPDCRVVTKNDEFLLTENIRGNLLIVPAGNIGWEISLVKGDTVPSPQGWYSREYNNAVPSTAGIYKSRIENSETAVWILMPYERTQPIVNARISERNEDGVMLVIEVDGDKVYQVFLPYNNCEKILIN